MWRQSCSSLANRRQENQRLQNKNTSQGKMSAKEYSNLKEPGFEHQRRLSRMILSMNMVNNGSV